ncbi:MAG: tRNA pseudouridine(13) synthase TruD [Gemmatales bacterium]|nr:tRNA pseudouridine(13) synthase TruD [Gemmatales bacterium]MDW7994282.1 tRNA pseudouridine(13) synthase TruD [Gemmatales bacterium]
MKAWEPEKLPRITADLPGIGGRIRVVPEDFEVEEIPAYEPSGVGEHVYLWVEKRGLAADWLAARLAQALGLDQRSIGMAGLKDRHAVARQWISIPASAEAGLAKVKIPGFTILRVSRHANKLRAGHLRGNRFRIRIREVHPESAQRLPALLERLRNVGLPNYYGEQRFGRHGDTLRIGFDLLRGQSDPRLEQRRFLRKLSLSAVQSWLYNRYLAERIRRGWFRQVVLGDVLHQYPQGGLFIAKDIAAEQERFDRREVILTGPIYGRRMLKAQEQAAELEAQILREAGLSLDAFAAFGKLLLGTRRKNVVFVDDLQAQLEGQDVILTFTLPAGSYATVLLDEIMKSETG